VAARPGGRPAMKALRDLRPCDACGGILQGGIFYVVRFSVALVNPRAVNEYLGMHQFFGGQASDALVENFAPSAATAVTVAMDHPEHRSLTTEAVVCATCYVAPITLAVLAETRTRAIEAATLATPQETSTP